MTHTSLRLLLIIIVLASFCGACVPNKSRENKIEFFVSPVGNINNPGTIELPFQRIEQARDAIRKFKPSERSREIVVYLRGGEYRLTQTIVFGIEDGGVGDYQITYSAYEEEIPVINSDLSITRWKLLNEYPNDFPEKAKGKVWVADVPRALTRFYTMYHGDTRLSRARKDGFVFKKIEYKASRSMNVYYEEDRFLLRKFEFEGGVLRNWPNLEDIEVGFAPVPWAMNLLPLESVNEETGEAWLAIEANAPMSAKKSHTKPWVENVIDYLDSSGHWVLNTKKRKIYYWPETGDPVNITVPKLKEFIRVEGKVDYDGSTDIPVKNLVFKGITFNHGERDTWDKDHKGWGIQHDWDKFDRGNAMLRFRGAEDCKVTQCRFTNSGGSAIRLDLHCQKISITNNLIDFVGHMGVLLCGYGPGTKDVNKKNTISNNLIHHVGDLIQHGAAIFIWQSGENKISNNLIHHVPRKAVGICGIRMPILAKPNVDFDEGSKTIRWTEIEASISSQGSKWNQMLPYLHARKNIVENNEIYRALEYLADGSVLNVSGAGEDNLIRNNYVHHIVSRASGVFRTDDWQRGTTFENNIIYQSNIAAFVHKGYNHIVNNLVVDCSVKESIRFASYPDEVAEYGSSIKHNVFYESGDEINYYRIAYRASNGISKPQDCVSDSNLFFCKGEPELGESHVLKNIKLGIETNSIWEDPKLSGMENQVFIFPKGSAAFQVGFKQISTDDIGLTEYFPDKYLKLDVNDHSRIPNFHRNRSGDERVYDFW
ncbi:MAG: right-handed parallel beta-helix repeat-containing protein [Reichenbachiella sp.]